MRSCLPVVMSINQRYIFILYCKHPDRSTPRRDKVYGGQDDLTAAIGWEQDGVTTVMFRKPASGAEDSGKQDHNFGGQLTLIWAYGQTGVEFYKEDVLLYHGGNKGRSTLGMQKILIATYLFQTI